MSGGHWGYKQYILDDIAEEVRNIAISSNRSDQSFDEEFGELPDPDLKTKTVSRFLFAAKYLELASRLVHRIDWLLSGDDGVETFNRLWDEEIAPLIDSLGGKDG